MKTRIVHTKFWKDEYVASLKPTEKLVYTYLLTNERINICHFMELSLREIAFDTGVEPATLRVILNKFVLDKKIAAYKNYIFLRNADKYESYTGSRNEIAKQSILKQLSPEVLDWYNRMIDTPIDTPIEGVYIPHINHKSKIRDIILEKDNRDRGVGEEEEEKTKTYSKLTDLTETDFQEIADKYKVPLAFVISKHEDLENWHHMKPQKNRYANYKRALIDWVKRDALKIINTAKGDPSKRAVDFRTNG